MAVCSLRFSFRLLHQVHLGATRTLLDCLRRGSCYNHPLVAFSSVTNTLQKEIRLPPFSKITANLKNVSLMLSSTEEEKMRLTYEGSDADIALREDGETLSLDVLAEGAAIPLSMHIPYQVGLNLNLTGSGMAKIHNVENEETRVTADKYCIELENIKSNKIHVQSMKGSISCRKTLKGNLDLNCVDGSITTEKIQSNDATLTSQQGSIETGDIYAQDLSVVSGNKIRMASVHGDCEIESAGDITIGTAEGKINLISEEGNIEIYLTEKVGHADIVSNTGDIALFFSSELGAQLDVEASGVDDSAAKSSFSEIRQREQRPCTRYRAEINDGGPRISVKSLGGKTVLRASSWLEAISTFKSSSKR